jgi:methylenetetrahydrofolate dehydrogenase (NADP+)/methenyltetrahydrofolate cyclohydrolase
MPVIIDGKATAARCNEETGCHIAALRARGVTPGLAVVLLGEHPASQAYVRSKDKTCRELGMHSRKLELPAATTQEDLLRLIAELDRKSVV